MKAKLSLCTQPIPVKILGLLVVTVLFLQCDTAISHPLPGTLGHASTVASKRKTPLHTAADKGDIEQVKKLLQQGADINALDEQGNTPLHVATLKRHAGLVKILLQNAAAVNATDEKGRTPLLLAVEEHGDQAVVNVLLQRRDIDLEAKDDELGYTPLYLAASRGHIEAFRALVNKGANINAQGNKTKLTPLHAACCNGYRMKMVSCLVQRGAHINAPSWTGETPLHYLCDGQMHIADNQQPTSMLKFFLNQGARLDINVQDHQGVTPLHTAARAGRPEILEMLLKEGSRLNIEVNKQDNQGYTALHDAALNSDEGCGLEMIEALTTYKAKVNIQDEEGNTPLHLIGPRLEYSYNFRESVSYTDMVVQALLRGGAQLAIQNKDGNTPLHSAILAKHVRLVKILLENKAPLHIPNLQGLTPFKLMQQEEYLTAEKDVELTEKNADLLTSNIIDEASSKKRKNTDNNNLTTSAEKYQKVGEEKEETGTTDKIETPEPDKSE